MNNHKPSTAHYDFTGQVIDQRYEILKKIGVGGMANVYQAKDRHLHRIVAIKIMHPHLAQSDQGNDFIVRFRREAQAAARLNHAGIVTVFDQGIYDGIPYLTMEYIEGSNLRKRIKERGTFAIGDALKNTELILRALGSAHKIGLIHRDMKPENILINHRGSLLITDFGLARVMSDVSLTVDGTFFGTPSYVAPESLESDSSAEVDVTVDCYAVGLILYELIAGVQPFTASTPTQVAMKHILEDVPSLTELNPSVPIQVSKLIQIMSARDRTRRPKDANQAAQLLIKVAQTLTAEELAVRLPPPEPKTSSGGYIREKTSNDPDEVAPIVAHHSDSLDKISDDIAAQDFVETNLLTRNDLNLIRKQTRQNKKSARTITIDDQRNNTTKMATLLTNWFAKNENKKSKIIIPITVVTIILMVLGTLGFLWYENYGPGAKITIPSGIIGSKSDVAEKILEDTGLKFKVNDEYSDTVAVGEVIKMTPNSGDLISKNNGTVTISVSKGIKYAIIPKDILSHTFDEATNLIKEAGFDGRINSSEKYSSTVKKGNIIKTSPKPGSKHKHNTEVTIYISKGAKPISMPNLIGIDSYTAKIKLDNLGIKYNLAEDYSDTVDKDYIISQSVQPSETAHEGDTITITISKGSKTVTVPNVVGMDLDEAETTLEDEGLHYALNDLGSVLKKVQKQSIEPGTKVNRGSVVTISIV